MMTYSIKEIADLAGVTTRAIRYYDALGLFPPARVGDNGYRYYDEDSLLRLQQILFFRELDVPLKDIDALINQPNFGWIGSLEKHRALLEKKADRLLTLINTIDTTIEAIRGENKMDEKEYFNGFDESQYEEEVKQRWGDTDKYKQSTKKWASYSKAQKDALKTEMGNITKRMVGEDPDVLPDDPVIQLAVKEYFAFLNQNFYTCDVEFLRGLADMWIADKRFAANYEHIRAGGAEFVRKAVHYFCDNAK